MALIPDSHIKQDTSQMLASFTPVYDLWRSKAPATEAPEKAEDCLANDMISIGRYMMAADNIAKALESKLLSEIIACLKTEHDHMPYDYEVATLDGALAAQLDAPSAIPDMLSYKVLKNWVEEHHGNRAVAGAILKLFISLANKLVIRDGRLTSEELQRLQQLEMHLQL